VRQAHLQRIDVPGRELQTAVEAESTVNGCATVALSAPLCRDPIEFGLRY
jgi:hypothetical protein